MQLTLPLRPMEPALPITHTFFPLISSVSFSLFASISAANILTGRNVMLSEMNLSSLNISYIFVSRIKFPISFLSRIGEIENLLLRSKYFSSGRPAVIIALGFAAWLVLELLCLMRDPREFGPCTPGCALRPRDIICSILYPVPLV